MVLNDKKVELLSDNNVFFFGLFFLVGIKVVIIKPYYLSYDNIKTKNSACFIMEQAL